ncbi:MAG: hypothetical protein AAB885_03005 [Patescibacteria group bacterium]
MLKNLLKPQILLLVLIVVAVAVLWKMGLLPVGSRDAYQAVFLSNNQVYFGKLANRSGQYATLTDIYYLQITQPLQPEPRGAQPVPNINLVKLGGELHGPTDKMDINRDHILFVEDLKGDSQVVGAIAAYKQSQVEGQ